MTSVSEEDWNRLPVSINEARSLLAFVRLPLCASANPPKASSDEKGWISMNGLTLPLVE